MIYLILLSLLFVIFIIIYFINKTNEGFANGSGSQSAQRSASDSTSKQANGSTAASGSDSQINSQCDPGLVLTYKNGSYICVDPNAPIPSKVSTPDDLTSRDSITPDKYAVNDLTNTYDIVADILNDNTDYAAAFAEYNDALQNFNVNATKKPQATLDIFFKKFNAVNKKLQSDLKINNTVNIVKTQTAIGKLAAQNPNLSVITPFKSEDLEAKKQMIVNKLDKLLNIYPDYDAVYNYLTSKEGQLEIADDPNKLDGIIKKINAFLLQYPLIKNPDKISDTPILSLSIREIYKNTLQTAIDLINDMSDVITRKDTLSNAQFRRLMFKTFTEPSRRFYVGIWLVFFSFVAYFIDSTV